MFGLWQEEQKNTELVKFLLEGCFHIHLGKKKMYYILIRLLKQVGCFFILNN